MSTKLIAKYDSTTVELSKDFIDALKKVMAAEVKMMQEQDPGSADCWHWGRCAVGDLSSAQSLEFQYGPEDELPQDGLGRFGVMVE